MPDTQPDRASGGVPHTFRLRMAWQWVGGKRQMPPELRRRKAFLYALATIATMADTAGRTRFSDTGQPIRFSTLAAAMGSREKDARRYLSAAIAAGVLTTEQAPRRGRTTVYVLQIPPRPLWGAALAVLDAGGTTDRDESRHDRAAAEFGPSSPEPAAAVRPSSSGGRSPFPTPRTEEGVRAVVARPGSGYDRPNGSGYAPPNNPGVLKNNPHEMVSVEPQPEGARGHDTHERADGPPSPLARQSLRAVPPPQGGRTGGRTVRTPDGQPPLLLPVQTPALPAERPAYAPADEEAHEPLPGPETGAQEFGRPRMPWRALVASECPDAAARVYRDRWSGDAATYLPDPTGT
ncbi:hypothetical protein [Streptomyces sp. NPDC048584]|uniref:hypothetical protein n=1 Tax=Streptomyces sp. NPDC048584 TaxID=3365573 RepID=UPI003722FCBD